MPVEAQTKTLTSPEPSLTKMMNPSFMVEPLDRYHEVGSVSGPFSFSPSFSLGLLAALCSENHLNGFR